MLCQKLVDRRLFKVELQKEPFQQEKIERIKNDVKNKLQLSDNEVEYFVFSRVVVNDAYRSDEIRINILFKDGTISDITDASDQLNIDVLAKTVVKYYLCYPK